MEKTFKRTITLVLSLILVVAGLSLVPKTTASADDAIIISPTTIQGTIPGVTYDIYLKQYTITATTGTYRVEGDMSEYMFVNNCGATLIVANGATISNLYDRNSVVAENYGTIKWLSRRTTVVLNLGTVISGSGTVNTNRGIVEESFALTVDVNAVDGVVKDATNCDVTTNYGVVEYLGGESRMVDNYGRVEKNAWIVQNNYGIIAKNDGRVWYNKPTGKVYQNFGTVESDEGYTTTEPEPVPDAGNESYLAVLDKTAADLEALAKKVANGEVTENQTVYLSSGNALPLFLMKTLKNCEGVSLDFSCTYMDTDYHIVIHGGKNLVVDENIPWYGPLCLNGMYGSGNETAETYTVVRGDTLRKIAGRLGTTVEELLAKNPAIKNPNRIWAGQTIHY